MKKSRKTASIFLVFLFFSNLVIIRPAKSYGGNKGSLWKLMGGIVLIGGGTFWAVDSFKRGDISNPKLDLSDWTWSPEENGSWRVDASGTVRNTGNVPVEDVKIYVTYYGDSNKFLERDWGYLNTYWRQPFPVGAVSSWHISTYNLPSEPKRAEISATYDAYVKKYETKSAIQGTAGIAVGLVGVYLVYDYFRDLGFFGKLEEKGIDIRLVNNPDSIYILASAGVF